MSQAKYENEAPNKSMLDIQYEIFDYALFIDERLIHLEYYLTDPRVCYLYAANVVKGRFEAGEKYIKNSDMFSFYYAIDILQERFLEAEELLKSKKSCYWEKYSKKFNITKKRGKAIYS